MSKRILVLVLFVSSLFAAPASSLTIDFDSITTTSSFSSLGLSSSFLGFSWSTGWGSNHVSAPVGLAFGVGLGTSGDTSARNLSGEQSLFIEFPSVVSIVGGFFRPLDEGLVPATTIQMRGFLGGALVAETAAMPLSGVWEFLAAGFGPVDRLEIRSDAPGTFFGIDDLRVVSEPVLPIVGLLLPFLLRRRPTR